MRIIVCGGREYRNQKRLHDFLTKLHKAWPIKLLITGGADGADDLAFGWAVTYGIPYHIERAEWDKHGRAAGPIRNKKMLALNPDLVVAFKGGAGTEDMIRQAREANVTVIIVSERN